MQNTTSVVSLTASANGTAAASNELVTELVTRALATAQKDGTSPHIEINVDTKAGTSFSLTITKQSLVGVVNSAMQSVVISSPFGTITFDEKALAAMADTATGDITISATKVDSAELPSSVKDLIGDRPVYNFTVTSGLRQINTFGEGTAIVSIPYSPSPGEKPNAIIICYLNDNGSFEILNHSDLSVNRNIVSFATKHFSRFAVAYKPVGFNDVNESAWYANAVDFVSARGLFAGVNADTFAPGDAMTRAMLVTVLARLDGVDLSGYGASGFSDVKPEAWYSKAVAWASGRKIVSGVGDGLFAPDKALSREETAVMLYNYMKYKGITLNIIGRREAFADNDKISEWARPAVKEMASRGIIDGVGGDMFAPKDTANRAALAQFISSLVKAYVNR